DVVRGECIADRGVAERRALHLAFDAVAGVERVVHVGGVTDQLGEARLDTAGEELDELRDADLFGMALAMPLAVEAGQQPHRRVATERDAPARSERLELR